MQFPMLRVGGTFAPPLTDKLLNAYDTLAAGAEPQVGDALKELLACCRAWWQLPTSTGNGQPHPSGRGTMVPLDEDVAEALEACIPWADELNLMGERFDALEAGELRNAAFHCLWFVRELELGREPITSDLL